VGSREVAGKPQETSSVVLEAATIFSDPLSTTFFDPDHSIGEERYITIGLSRFGTLLIVAHADRGDNVRIISARKATRHERKFYEEQSG
jgi:uncharacterized DUF497 family protein